MELSRYAVLAVFTLAIVACKSAPKPEPPKPDHYGVYAISGGRTLEMRRISDSELNTYLHGGQLSKPANAFPSGSEITIEVYGDYKDYELHGSTMKDGHLTVDPTRNTALQTVSVDPAREVDHVTFPQNLSDGVYVFTALGCNDNAWDSRCIFPFSVGEAVSQ